MIVTSRLGDFLVQLEQVKPLSSQLRFGSQNCPIRPRELEKAKKELKKNKSQSQKQPGTDKSQSLSEKVSCHPLRRTSAHPRTEHGAHANTQHKVLGLYQLHESTIAADPRKVAHMGRAWYIPSFIMVLLQLFHKLLILRGPLDIGVVEDPVCPLPATLHLCVIGIELSKATVVNVGVRRMEMDCCEGRAGRQQILKYVPWGFSLGPCDDARCQLMRRTSLQGTRTSTRVSLTVPGNYKEHAMRGGASCLGVCLGKPPTSAPTCGWYMTPT